MNKQQETTKNGNKREPKHYRLTNKTKSTNKQQ